MLPLFFLPLFGYIFLFPLQNCALKKIRWKIRIILIVSLCQKWRCFIWLKLSRQFQKLNIIGKKRTSFRRSLLNFDRFDYATVSRHIKTSKFFSVKCSHAMRYSIRLSKRIQCLSRIFLFGSFVHSSNFKCYPNFICEWSISILWRDCSHSCEQYYVSHTHTHTHKITFRWISGICTHRIWHIYVKITWAVGIVRYAAISLAQSYTTQEVSNFVFEDIHVYVCILYQTLRSQFYDITKINITVVIVNTLIFDYGCGRYHSLKRNRAGKFNLRTMSDKISHRDWE